MSPWGCAAERVGDAPERLALRTGRPVAAGRAARPWRRTGVAASSSASATAPTDAPSPIPTTAPSRIARAQDLGREPPDDPSGQVLRPSEGRGEVHGVEPEPPAQRVGRWRLGGVPVDDPDLDDPLGPRPLQEPADLRPRDAEPIRDGVLGLAELVVQPAGLDEEIAVGSHARRRGEPRCTDVQNRCAAIYRASSSRVGWLSTALVPRPSHARLADRGRFRGTPAPARGRSPSDQVAQLPRSVVASARSIGSMAGPRSSADRSKVVPPDRSPRATAIAPSWNRSRASSAPSARAAAISAAASS